MKHFFNLLINKQKEVSSQINVLEKVITDLSTVMDVTKKLGLVMHSYHQHNKVIYDISSYYNDQDLYQVTLTPEGLKYTVKILNTPTIKCNLKAFLERLKTANDDRHE